MRCPLLRATLLAAGLLGGGCARKAPATYVTDAVTRGTLREVVTATGEISARVKVNVGSQVSGTVARLRVDFNSPVQRGDVLAELDPRIFAAQLGRSEASVAVAEAEVDKQRVALMDAERSLRRVAALAAKHMVAQADLDAAEVQQAAAAAAVKGGQAALQQARADRELAATNLAFTKIRSPIDGVVIDRQVDVGQTVAAQFQVATLFVIANDMRAVQLLASIDEADVGKVRAGMAASFTVDAYPGVPFSGHIREVRQAPIASSTATAAAGASGQVVTYAAVVDADNPEYRLRQGMTAQVSITVLTHPDALLLPNRALRFRPPAATDGAAAAAAPLAAGRGRVYRLEGGAPVAVELAIGASDGRVTEVLAGLAAGDAVITASGGAHGPGGARRGIL